MQNKKLTPEQITDLDRKKFTKQFISRMKGKSLEEIAEHVWKYGSDEWSKGYALGVRGYIADEPGIAEEPSDPRYHGLNGWEPETE